MFPHAKTGAIPGLHVFSRGKVGTGRAFSSVKGGLGHDLYAFSCAEVGTTVNWKTQYTIPLRF